MSGRAGKLIMEFQEVLKKRHSVRKFTDEPIGKEITDAILELTQTAPSSRNSKSSAFMVIDDRDTLEAISQMRQSGSGLIAGAAAAIVVLGDRTKTDLWLDNAAISATYIQLCATAMDLGSCWVHVNGRPRSKTDASLGTAESYLRELLGIKEEFGILCVVALGYEAVQ